MMARNTRPATGSLGRPCETGSRIHMKSSAAKLTTAATSWLSVREEKKSPTAMNEEPRRKNPMYPPRISHQPSPPMA